MNNRGVYLNIDNNQQGFSLLDTLIGLFTLLVVVSLFSSVFTYWTMASPKVNEFSYEEYILFINQLKMEFKHSNQYWVNEQNNTLYLLQPEDEDIIHYEKYQDKVRRQVSGFGHEVFLQHITSFHVFERSYGIEVEVIIGNRKKLTRRIVHPVSFHQNLILIGEE